MNHLCLHVTFIFMDHHRFIAGAEHAQMVLWASFPAYLEARIDVSVHLPPAALCLLIMFIILCRESQGKGSSAYVTVGSSQRWIWIWRGWRGEQQVGHNGDRRENRKARRKCSDRQRRGSAIKRMVTQVCEKSLHRLCAQGSVCWHAPLWSSAFWNKKLQTDFMKRSCYC